MELKIRDGLATLNDDTTEITMPSGSLEIIAPDGRTLFDIRVLDDGSLEVSASSCVKIGDTLLDTGINIMPRACNQVYIRRNRYDAR